MVFDVVITTIIALCALTAVAEILEIRKGNHTHER